MENYKYWYEFLKKYKRENHITPEAERMGLHAYLDCYERMDIQLCKTMKELEAQTSMNKILAQTNYELSMVVHKVT